jgi:hypothetical protein
MVDWNLHVQKGKGQAVSVAWASAPRKQQCKRAAGCQGSRLLANGSRNGIHICAGSAEGPDARSANDRRGLRSISVKLDSATQRARNLPALLRRVDGGS